MKSHRNRVKIIFILVSLLFLFGTRIASADIGSKKLFYVDSSHDATQRYNVTAVLVATSNRAYFYIDEQFWNFSSQKDVLTSLGLLGNEFDNKIYPTLTNIFGSEWNPGIDNDSKITILIEPMSGDAGGYFRTNDEYQKIQVTDSNEREMIYINSKYILDKNLKAFVAHEFTHLITFNQKNKKYGVEEDTWLNEARAEYSPTLLGYDDVYDGSYLETRVQDFSEQPTGSLIDWQGTKYDYAKVNLFIHYLVDQYGLSVLVDSLQSPKTGIDSINYALQKEGAKEDFYQVFTNWTIAVLINDCTYGSRYCYLNKNLQNFYLVPQINFLPLVGNTTLTVSDTSKSWAANWYKIISGGGGTLKFHFEGDPQVAFNVTYITKNQSGAYTVKSLVLDKLGKGDFYVDNFGNDIASLFIIPYLKGDDGGVSDNYFHSFSWSSSMTRQDSSTDNINKLLVIIDDLKKQIAAILAKKQVVINNQSSNCSQINNNLSLGMSGGDVTCLQQFLKGQGPTIYPEGLVTGSFGNLTAAAVIRFQEKYASIILAPIGLSKGTGYVGNQTRMKINQILNGG